MEIYSSTYVFLKLKYIWQPDSVDYIHFFWYENIWQYLALFKRALFCEVGFITVFTCVSPNRDSYELKAKTTIPELKRQNYLSCWQ